LKSKDLGDSSNFKGEKEDYIPSKWNKRKFLSTEQFVDDMIKEKDTSILT